MAVFKATGIDGSSLLGFLAAVGSIRLLCEEWTNACLSFNRATNHAIFTAEDASDSEAIVSSIVRGAFSFTRKDELKLLGVSERPKDITSSVIKELSITVREERDCAAFLSGLVCDSDLQAEMNKAEAGATTLCAANGASHQKMFTTMRDIQNLRVDEAGSLVASPTILVREDHLYQALHESWKFQDVVPEEAKWMGTRKPTLRWDESAERLHALRFADPNDDPEPFRTELGAYALAVHALPCLPVVPWRHGPLTVSSAAAKNGAVDFYWPLWETPLTLHAMKMLLWSAEARFDPESARQRGVFRLMSARRLTQEKGKLTFLPAKSVW
jgi:hypothetical protein